MDAFAYFLENTDSNWEVLMGCYNFILVFFVMPAIISYVIIGFVIVALLLIGRAVDGRGFSSLPVIEAEKIVD